MPLTPRRIRDGFLACLLLGLACPAPAADEADLGPGVSLTIYNQDFAVVKERRLLDLTRDAGVVRFAQ